MIRTHGAFGAERRDLVLIEANGDRRVVFAIVAVYTFQLIEGHIFFSFLLPF